MSDELGAVLDAPEVTDAVVDDQAIVDTAVVDDAAAVVDTAKVEDTTDWRKVPAELKEFFKTPAGKGAKDAWFERNAYKELLPDGVKQAKEILGFLEEHGGKDGLTTALGELQGKAAELDAINQKIESGDVSLVKDLTPETVAKLGPAMSEQWRQADPEGWGASMAGVVAATMRNADIPMFIDRLGLNLEFGKLEEVKTQVAQLKEFLGSFAAKAQAPTQTRNAQPDAKFTERETALSQRELDAFKGEVERGVNSFREPLINKELESFFKRRPNDADAKQLAISTVEARVKQRMFEDQKLQDSLNLLWARKDKAGFLKLSESREKAAIAEIAPQVGRAIYGNPAVAKTVPDPVAGKVTTQSAKTPLTSRDRFEAIYNR